MADTEFKKQMDKWLKSKEGKECQEGKTSGEYMQNRLFLAFAAGWNAASKRLKKLIEECG